jgi:hypothetical protein
MITGLSPENYNSLVARRKQIEVGLKEARGRSVIYAAALKQASADKAVAG